MDILLPAEEDFKNWELPEKTDLAKILGVTEKGYDFWLKSDSSSCLYPKMRLDGNAMRYTKEGEKGSISPMILKSDVSSLNVQIQDGKFEYGEYPQSVEENVITTIELEDAFESGQLRETGRVYTFEDPSSDGSFLSLNYPEYEHGGAKYIRVSTPANIPSGLRTKNDWLLSPSENYWIKVEPIVWEEKKATGNFVATKQLLSGITYHYGDFKDCRQFEDADIFNYLNDYFKQDMMPISNVNLIQNSQNKKIDNIDDFEDGLEAFEEKMKEEYNLQKNGHSKQTGRKRLSRQERYGIEVSDIPMTVTEQINFYVQNNMSFMLHGPSGVGKTARVEQIDPNLTAVPLWNGVLPEDIVGKVRYPDGVEKLATEENIVSGEWVAPDWYVELLKKCEEEPNKAHVLFIDEVTNARPTTQSLIFHITLKRAISPSKGKLPDNAVVVLAGNSKDESGAAYNMPEPLFRRMCGHIYLKPDVKEWLAWGSQKDMRYKEEDRLNIHPLVASFVAAYGKKCFYSAYDEEEAPKWAMDPRGWKQISDIIYNNGGLIQKELLVSKMGPENAASFIGYAKNPPLTIDDILEGSYSEKDIPSSADERLALALSLRYVYPSELVPVRAFVRKLGGENLDVFDSAWVAGDAERALQMQAAMRASARGRV